jgi:hypothetical protein
MMLLSMMRKPHHLTHKGDIRVSETPTDFTENDVELKS